MKKLLLVLALLILSTSGAFATIYPSCYKGYASNGASGNGTNGDNASYKGWCIDGYGVLTPKSVSVDTTNPNNQGGMAVPVLNITNSPTGGAVTYDTLIAQQTGTYITDMGGQTSAASTGSGGVYILPAAMPGSIFTFSVGSKSTITIDTLATTDSILFSPSGTAVAVGNGIRNTSKNAGDSISLYSNVAGFWSVEDVSGTWADSSKARG